MSMSERYRKVLRKHRKKRKKLEERRRLTRLGLRPPAGQEAVRPAGAPQPPRTGG
jgi:hypothetical protein